MADSKSSKTVVVTHEQGLHARPAEMLARTAMGYDSQVDLVYDGRRIDAKSILNILTLGATAGSSVEIHAQGPDAEQAVVTLAALVASDFDPDATQTQDGPPRSGAAG